MNFIWNVSTKFWLDRCTVNDTTNWYSTERYTHYRKHHTNVIVDLAVCCHCYSTNNNRTTFSLSLMNVRCICSNLPSWNLNWKSTIRISKLQTIPINPVHQRMVTCTLYICVSVFSAHIILMTASCCLSLLSISFSHLSIIPGWCKPHSQLKLIAVLAANETIEFQSGIDFRGTMCLTGFSLSLKFYGIRILLCPQIYWLDM